MLFMLIGALIFLVGLLFGYTLARMPPVERDEHGRRV